MLVEVVAPADHEALALEAVRLAGKPVPTDLGPLEAHLRELAKVHSDVLALGGDSEREPWTRIRVQLVHSGLWASLKPCSRAVYMVLAALSDRRKRVTICGVEKVAKLSGLSVPRTLFAYRELRDLGLIWRRRIKLGDKQPYLTGLCNPKRWKRTSAVPGSRPI